MMVFATASVDILEMTALDDALVSVERSALEMESAAMTLASATLDGLAMTATPKPVCMNALITDTAAMELACASLDIVERTALCRPLPLLVNVPFVVFVAVWTNALVSTR